MTVLLGCDPGLATFGVVLVEVKRDRAVCFFADVFYSPATPKHRRSSLSADRVRRTRELASWLHRFMSKCTIDVCAAEALAGTQGASPAIAMGLGWGVLAGALEMLQVPLVSTGPKEWRKHLVRGGDEETAHAEAMRRIESGETWVHPERGQIERRFAVHACDALGVAAWGIDQIELFGDGTFRFRQPTKGRKRA